jgi:hypothetical protein
VGDEGWESAKIDYEKASYELAEAWHKIHPRGTNDRAPPPGLEFRSNCESFVPKTKRHPKSE